MGLTEYQSPTFHSTGNPCLDFFFHVVPDTPPETLTRRLHLAWEHDPLKALKLICNLRGTKGTGKADEEGGYRAALWLHENHPMTLALNLDKFAGLGSSKDLPEILCGILQGPDARAVSQQDRDRTKQMRFAKMRRISYNRYRGTPMDEDDDDNSNDCSDEDEPMPKPKPKPDSKSEPTGKNEPEADKKKRRLMWKAKKLEWAKQRKEAKRIKWARRAVERFNTDPNFKFLHDRVSDYFAHHLRSDLEMLRRGEISRISQTAKWCPSLDSSHDKVTLLCEMIAKRVFPRDECPEYEGVEEPHYAYRVRDRLRKEVLGPLRRALDLPELHIGANDWGSIDYELLGADETRLLERLFLKHDKERFCKYLVKLRKGETKIGGAGDLFPHKILAPGGCQVAEFQWSGMVDDMAEKGKLRNCLAICDVSSMDEESVKAAAALGLLVSELSDEPWKGKMITFADNPELRSVDGLSSIKKKARFVKGLMTWGEKDLQKVFDLLLKVAVDGGLTPEKMIKRLFVFSDMEFSKESENEMETDDEAIVRKENEMEIVRKENEMETDYEAIVRKFGEKGYGNCVPEIVFWNVRESKATPVVAGQAGVALVSGHSRNLMKMFVGESGVSGEMNPVAVMDLAIAGEEYEGLVAMASKCFTITTLHTAVNFPQFCHVKPRYLSAIAASSAPAVSLIGPAEIYRTSASPPPPAAPKKSDPFMDLMLANYNNPPPMGVTENNSPTFLSSGNHCLDFFFHVVPDTPKESVTTRLELAWKENPLTALKLVFNLRGVRGTGKSDREGCYAAALWLHDHHPKTLAGNVGPLAEFGYFKDLLEILFRILEGPDARDRLNEAHQRWKMRQAQNEMKQKFKGYNKSVPRGPYFPYFAYSPHSPYFPYSSHSPYSPRSTTSGSKQSKRTGPKLSPKEMKIERAKRAVEKYNTDPKYQFLHDRVSDYFAKCLRADMEILNSSDQPKRLSFAAKWCPSLYAFYDKFTLVCETIAKKVFPRADIPEYEGLGEIQYASRVRNRLRKEVLVPLRKALELPEVHIGAGNWGAIKYNRVASLAMKRYKRLFFKHDEERFQEFLGKVKKGEAKITAGALLPHQIISGLYDGEADGGEVAELQWKRMVDDVAKHGKLSNCLAVCDVSGSMHGIPMDVSVALGLLVSEISEEPWKGKVITFSAKPQLHEVKGESLREKTESVQRMDWEMNTDFQKVFDLLLSVAVEGNLKPENMIKRIFVFSDMEFDQASLNPWETDYQAIVRKFGEKGYGDCVPEIVFWNLRDSRATPVPAHQSGVALVSGFLKNLMQVFLKEGGVISPLAAMELAISGEEYEQLIHQKPSPPSPVSLIGPPEIYQKPSAPLSPAAPKKTDPFMDAMIANYNNFVAPTPSMMGLTENYSPTFLSSGNHCLDFFFHVVPDTPAESVTRRLELAWKEDPLTALKLVFNLRGVRGTGKSDREGCYAAALWLHDNHPKTLAGNVGPLAEFGYFKDLLEILFRILEGPNARDLMNEAHEQWKLRQAKKEMKQKLKEDKSASGAYSLRSIRGLKHNKTGPRLSPEEKRIERAKRVVERYNTDPNYQFLHERVSDYFAKCLRSDMEILNSGGHPRKISFAAKWCPSLYSFYDELTLVCETIAKKVFPRAEFPEYEDLEEAHYAYRVRDRLRKEVLVPLRKALELPEVHIGAGNWVSIRYNLVASLAMKLYKRLFFKHDGERFKGFLGKVKKGEAKITAGALLPHQIISGLYDGEADGGEVAELQWRRMVDDVTEHGKLSNCLAVCDVSGSMAGIPMDVSVALGLLVSEISEEPWKGKVITFSERPQLHVVKGESLKERTEFVRRMNWMMNTDFQKVFDLLLAVAVEGKLKPENMIKRVFVFSDMEFDQASLNPWETDYQAIVRKFGEKGYGDCVPEIVFWNLRDSRATPVPAHQPGVALVSGFSKNLMKVFLKEGGVFNPLAAMEAAISGKEYDKLVVLD
ncbi:hypothetical protein STAS_12477 [Striga asiatica]|uniref:VWFA domain-containing protein n=1 Tax=Striga asiatica TaxID=4170 RepID=A0A5A7PTL0_STRAF|nr:hypothetical protein STAS_12477 [Striga asiatica]